MGDVNAPLGIEADPSSFRESSGHSIQVEGLSKWLLHNGHPLDILEDISFTVQESEFVVIVGPSGCGKTTILKILAGTVEPSDGSVAIDGEPVSGPSPETAMVFQEFVLLPWKTVLQNVELGLKVQGETPKRRRHAQAKEWIDNVGLEGYEHAYPHELSGGMKQRVGLARALSANPRVLLMDEPFGSLDAQTKDRLQSELLELWQNEAKTILFVTHDIDEALFLGDRILVLSEKPASITAKLSVNLDRPRWKRRVEVEQSREFGRLKRRLRQELGLHVE